MAVIREELVLADRFSAVFSKYLNMGRTASGTMQAAANSQNAFTEAAVQSSAALEEMAGTGSRAAEAVEEIGDAARQMAGASGDAANRQNLLNRSMRSGSSAADSLTRKIMGLAAAYLSLRSARSSSVSPTPGRRPRPAWTA